MYDFYLQVSLEMGKILPESIGNVYDFYLQVSLEMGKILPESISNVYDFYLQVSLEMGEDPAIFLFTCVIRDGEDPARGY